MTLFRFRSLYLLLAILLMMAFIFPTQTANAQEDLVTELISTINELRASHGLAPYTVDPGLMALAQEHSAYQASIHTSTHLHSDGRNPPRIGVVENVAGGDIGYLDARAAVYDIWSDPGHMRTMVGFANGSMGVGVADDGTTTYITLEVRPANSATSAPNSSGTGTAPALLTPIPIAPLMTTTPRADGTIVHVVGYGQTLWSIALAYGIQIEQIRAWNNMAVDANDIYAGQKLLVRPASLVMVSPTPSAGSETTQTDSIAGPIQSNTVQAEVSASPAVQTPTAADLAAPGPTADGSPRDGIQPAANNTKAGSGLLVPLIAGGSVVVGCALLFILRNNKNLY